MIGAPGWKVVVSTPPSIFGIITLAGNSQQNPDVKELRYPKSVNFGRTSCLLPIITASTVIAQEWAVRKVGCVEILGMSEINRGSRSKSKFVCLRLSGWWHLHREGTPCLFLLVLRIPMVTHQRVDLHCPFYAVRRRVCDNV
jgi:hypothetical protein